MLVYADFHIHIGINASGKWVKIPTSRALTFEGIVKECLENKGIQAAGIVDCMSPAVQEDIDRMLVKKLITEHPGGGFFYKGILIMPAAEIETKESSGKLSHHLVFFEQYSALKAFGWKMSEHISNISLSSQNCGLSASQLLDIADSFGGYFIPAHAFTPHKSMYGSSVKRLSEMFRPDQIQKICAIELGLSADTFLADRITELENFSFLTNSDAHSLAKIAREFNVIEVDSLNMHSIFQALKFRKNGQIVKNYGLHPELGKYHLNFCRKCEQTFTNHMEKCPCGGQIVTGVYNRIDEIADNTVSKSPQHRPEYIHFMPLEYLPGLGKKTIKKLMDSFGSEIEILLNVPISEIAFAAGKKAAHLIELSRNGRLSITAGGGGNYGRVKL